MEGLSWILLACLAALLVAAAVCDLKSREIPHWVVIGIALLAPAFWWATQIDLWPHVAARIGIALLVFGLFAGAFALGMMGGGDVKLIAALSLWMPPAAILMTLLIMSFAGGVLTAGMMIWARVRKPAGQIEIPYGVAIAFGGLWVIGEPFLNHFG